MTIVLPPDHPPTSLVFPATASSMNLVTEYMIGDKDTFAMNLGDSINIDGTALTTADPPPNDKHAHCVHPTALLWLSYRLDIDGVYSNASADGLSELYMRMPRDGTNAGVCITLESGGIGVNTWNDTAGAGFVPTGDFTAASLSVDNSYAVYFTALLDEAQDQIEFSATVINSGEFTVTYTSGYTDACTRDGTWGPGFFAPAGNTGLFTFPATLIPQAAAG